MKNVHTEKLGRNVYMCFGGNICSMLGLTRVQAFENPVTGRLT